MATQRPETTTVALPSFTPALRPPAGVVSNPDNPTSLAYLADITIAICIPLVTVFFLMRSYVRIVIKRTFIFEDFLVTVAWAGTVAYCGIMRATMSHNGGKHGWDITIHQARQASYWFNVAAIEYGVMIGVTKLAVLWLYRRVFSPVRWSKFDISIVSLIVIIFGFYSTTSIVKIFECSPREKIWNRSIPGKCVEMSIILNVSGAFNTVTDYLILFLPIHAVRKLQMDHLKRILVVLAFTFGLWYVRLAWYNTHTDLRVVRQSLQQLALLYVSETAAIPIHRGNSLKYFSGELRNLHLVTCAFVFLSLPFFSERRIVGTIVLVGRRTLS